MNKPDKVSSFWNTTRVNYVIRTISEALFSATILEVLSNNHPHKAANTVLRLRETQAVSRGSLQEKF